MIDANQLRRRIKTARREHERAQLTTYVAHVMAKKVDPDAFESTVLGYDAASELPLPTLRRLFREDDWGEAWSLFGSEQTEYFEQDQGRIETCDEILALIDQLERSK